MTGPNIFGLIGVTIFGLALTACAPAPQPYYTLYNVQPADWGGLNYPQPVPPPPLPPAAPIETAPVSPAPVASIPEPPVPPAPSPPAELPPAADQPPPDQSPKTALPPLPQLPPAPPPKGEAGNDDDCVGWWRICHFL
jgi:hypothetical protein